MSPSPLQSAPRGLTVHHRSSRDPHLASALFRSGERTRKRIPLGGSGRCLSPWAGRIATTRRSSSQSRCRARAAWSRAEEALAELTRARKSWGSHPATLLYINRGRALTQLYRLDEAERSFARAVELELRQRRRAAHARAASIHARRSESRARPRRRRRRRTDRTRACSCARRSLPQTRRSLAAPSRCCEMHSLQPGAPPRLRTALASTLHQAGRVAEALVEAQTAVDAMPDDSTALETLVSVQLSLGRHDAARTIIRAQRSRYTHDQLWIAHEATAARLAGRPALPASSMTTTASCRCSTLDAAAGRALD